jgi:hypothetical protein
MKGLLRMSTLEYRQVGVVERKSTARQIFDVTRNTAQGLFRPEASFRRRRGKYSERTDSLQDTENYQGKKNIRETSGRIERMSKWFDENKKRFPQAPTNEYKQSKEKFEAELRTMRSSLLEANIQSAYNQPGAQIPDDVRQSFEDASREFLQEMAKRFKTLAGSSTEAGPSSS